MGSNRRHLVVDYETFEAVTVECVKEFIKHHPEFKGMKISQNFIIRKLAEFYLK